MSKKVSNSRERILELMNYYGINQTELCQKTGLQKSALSNYLNGDREPRQKQISLIADPFNINPAWLMGYDVPMSINSVTNEENKPFTDEQIAKAIQLYNQFVMATPETQQAIQLLLGQTKQIADALKPVTSQIPKVKPHLPKLPRPVSELPRLKKDTDK